MTRISAYTRNRNRIMSYIRRQRKQGFDIPFYFPTERQLRQSGVRGTELTKLTNELKKYTAKELKRIRVPINEPSQESTNEQDFTPPFNPSTDESFFTDAVINAYRSHVKTFNSNAQRLLLSWLDRILQQNSKEDVATMLEDGASHGHILNYTIVYSSEKLYDYMSEMLDYLPEAGPLFKSQLMDAMEEEEAGW